ncbi:Crp/Fnr family transcriptional regulator [Flavobacterium sp.]|uniref:Crp/Fnr family transcriptional regulator n=1 Tax=Flavobacterium sp. TaxID=239 RepID=UPI00260466C3|nr:Crp/Fnr family transcriptional regulator [Flavobacterium sp.]MDD3003318.1 Crp/Fnr family transcriptional regulator [Flavobacterium sp.]
MIRKELLEQYGAIEKHYDKSDIIFEVNTVAHYYFQIISGEVKMNNYNEEGKEFIQGFFKPGESFGEPPLFVNRLYPANAIATEDAVILAIKKESFKKFLLEHPQEALSIIENLAQRLHYKATMAAEIASEDPEHRVLQLIDYSIKHFNLSKDKNGYLVDFTRQQIGDLTGLRVETVIRAVKSLEKKRMLKIINRKVYREI